MAIYRNSILKENPIYGGNRLGIHYREDNSDVYQLTDHLGNVRAVVTNQGGNTLALVGKTDYYPFGMPMPNPSQNVNSNYRYAYQGQEKDPETQMEAFELRLWDGRIGRWLTVAPYGQHHSPYMGMGNNPITRIDPDGGADCPNPPYNPQYDTALINDINPIDFSPEKFNTPDFGGVNTNLDLVLIGGGSSSNFFNSMSSFLYSIDSYLEGQSSGSYYWGEQRSEMMGAGRKLGKYGAIYDSYENREFIGSGGGGVEEK